MPLRAAAAVALAALLTAGCSLGAEDFDSNRPDPSPIQDLVVRTPQMPSTDQPSQEPLVQDLPGASGGAPGQGSATPTVPDSSPGDDSGGDSGAES